ncbi:hypothetical protein JMJ35_004773 [Cladonia borealis]|uniref:Major facilitator superfamily (MFS) profile domain-containing protein n=1 Tax=Cladonia borealis TaxID=184061 RepID=A0AA39UAU0_9LECA|nr:hypothetical protein JMJ35_004773 [Cladonia borealis]
MPVVEESETAPLIPSGDLGSNTSDRSLWQTVIEYRQSLLWSTFFALSALLWGYDNQVAGSLLGAPQFRKDFGYIFDGQAVISAPWLAAFSAASSIGGLFGCILGGGVADKSGRRWALGFCSIISISAVFVEVIATAKSTLLVGKLVNGFALGVFLTVSSAYCAESCPVTLRGVTTSGVHLFIGLGSLVASTLVKIFGHLPDSRAYRGPFALQWLFPTILLLGLPFCPESPWWLVRKGNTQAAARSLRRLGFKDVDTSLESIRRTVYVELVDQMETSYLDCFRGVDFRRTEIAMGVFTISQLVGPVFIMGYSTYFFELAGLSTSNAFSLGIGIASAAVISNMFSWLLVNSVGRRLMYLYGTLGLFGCLLTIGLLDVKPDAKGASAWWQSAMCALYQFIYYLAVGPITYTLFSEIASPRLRSRTIGLGLVVQNLFGLALNLLIPYLINPDEANLRGKIGFIFAGTSIFGNLWVYYRVPETKGKDFEELTMLFENHVPARDFATYSVKKPKTGSLRE